MSQAWLGMLISLGILLAPLGIAAQDELRYVAPTKDGDGFALWTNRMSFTTCVRAMLRGREQDRRMFCEDGVAGIKPRIGTVAPGAEVELLDSRECGDMAHVRVLTGPLKGETGCISATGLTRIRPEPK